MTKIAFVFFIMTKYFIICVTTQVKIVRLFQTGLVEIDEPIRLQESVRFINDQK